MLPLLLVSLALEAQQPEVRIRTTVPLVLVPTTVTDSAGKPYAGLDSGDFEVYDGNRLVRHELEVTNQPVSVVLCVQTNRESGPALAKVVKIGSLLLPLIAGEDGAAALLTYSDRLKLRQEFTADQARFTGAIRAMRPDGFGARMLDAVGEGVQLLGQRGERQRKVLIVVGETRDRGSETKLDQVLRTAARTNVTIYSVSFSVYLTAFTSRGDERFGKKREEDPEDTRPKVYQPGEGSLVTALVELSRLGQTNTAGALTKATGGARFSFLRLKALEEMFLKVGEDLHNQYLLSFVPQSAAPGYHDLRVVARGREGLTVRARPGYWAAGQ
ncbi:MAG: VWA domain-containing protein [Bryobacterales bacterium]|nr:VWA domain-containing protein [Bryobacterales bacterium]